MKNKTRSHKLTSSLHCFWHIWQYQRSFWRPLALILFPIALGLRKSAFPILISQKKSRFTETIITVPVFQHFLLFLALWRESLALLTCVFRHWSVCTSTIARLWWERLSALYLRLRRPAALTFIEVNMFARTSAAVFLPQWYEFIELLNIYFSGNVHLMCVFK